MGRKPFICVILIHNGPASFSVVTHQSKCDVKYCPPLGWHTFIGTLNALIPEIVDVNLAFIELDVGFRTEQENLPD